MTTPQDTETYALRIALQAIADEMGDTGRAGVVREAARRLDDPAESRPREGGEPDGYLMRFVANKEPETCRFIPVDQYSPNPLAEGFWETRPFRFIDRTTHTPEEERDDE